MVHNTQGHFIRFLTRHSLGLLAATGLLVLAAADIAPAQESTPPALTLELNALQPSEKGCRLTFVVTNSFGVALDKVGFEVALFNQAQVVDRITVLDFKELPQGKTKVRRFDLGELDCTKITRVLVNDSTECAGAGIDPKACIRQLNLTTKSGIQFGS